MLHQAPAECVLAEVGEDLTDTDVDSCPLGTHRAMRPVHMTTEHDNRTGALLLGSANPFKFLRLGSSKCRPDLLVMRCRS